MNYNEKGQFKGIATINFKSSNNATKAVEKYNGAPIDGGSSKLKLELIIDPTKKPLAARIAPNAPAKAPKIAAAKQQLKQQKKKPAPAKAPQQKKKPVKKTKKTVEELDQEMADYFDN
jgi:THO complex subunit 4